MSVKNAFIIIGILIFIIFFIPIFLNILNPGNTVGMLIGIAIILAAAFHKQLFNIISKLWLHSFGKGVVLFVSAIIAFSAIYVSVLTIFIISARMDKPENPAAVVVLGCKVKGDRPSRMLKRRLNAALEYLEENQNVVCIVTGGKGDDEMFAEAEVMQKYLIDNGISPERIVKEDKSTNTFENLHNAFKLYNIDPEQEIAVATDGFHQYRAGFIAQRMGYSTTSINPATDINGIILAPTYTVREWLAITNEYIKSIFT